MELQIVSIYDNKAEAFLNPVFVESKGAAIRSFGDAVNNPETEYSKHPGDYAMHSLGVWDNTTGTFTPNENGTPELAKATSLLNLSD